ncbi:sulfatase [Nitrosomonas ureae]|uniref:Arylsulfatase A n=1 Tax=Nitrosomonas ureae TaxID=44577 RepID=A0A1H2FKW6_9PROT|nr:sulfatase [Nitrosomonas ureae]PXX16153.1 arylsulfatase A-like enzyme [Nitrosomonas ureae]SDU07598.1 Arylsulfatase A [Nitrosomonas ureae]
MSKSFLAVILVFSASFLAMPISAVAKPNFIFILTDDMTPDDLRFMPRTQEYFAVNGVRFTNTFVSYAACCPSRATFLTGRYTTNHGVRSNVRPSGGFDAFYNSGLESATIATKLQESGYSTAYFGKYFNEYGTSTLVDPESYIPPGWNYWYTFVNTKYFNYKLNENGITKSYGDSAEEYGTDVIAMHARNFLEAALLGDSPFFMMIAPYAAHASIESTESPRQPIPATRHKNLFNGMNAPRFASFNQEDVSKKNFNVRNNSLLLPEDVEWIDNNFRARIRSLQSVDEMVGKLIDQLQNSSKERETYLIFTSDNGYWFGEHRFKVGKADLYDQSHHVPFAMAGPNVQRGLVRNDLVVNTDFFPTILELASVSLSGSSYDGRSFRTLIETSTRETTFSRNSFLIETGVDQKAGIRFKSYAYFESAFQGVPLKELYDTQLDPDLVYNIAEKLTGESSASLQSALAELLACKGDTCRALENKFSDLLVKLTD